MVLIDAPNGVRYYNGNDTSTTGTDIQLKLAQVEICAFLQLTLELSYYSASDFISDFTTDPAIEQVGFPTVNA